MLNHEVFSSNPKDIIWKNQGVAKVDGHKFTENLDELKFELQHFVCEGQYKKGLERILGNFISHIGQDEQKAVWISGFFGSGKSHLCKMLRALWEDTELPGGLSARGAAQLPDDVKTLLKDLDTEGRRQGGLIAVSGTLSAGNSNFIRRTLAELVLESRGLPADIPKGRFVLWLRRENLEEAVRQNLEGVGKNWETEVNNFRVSTTLHQAIAQVQPALGDGPGVRDLLKQQYPSLGSNDITNDELRNLLREVLAPKGNFPLTLIVLDEMQQYIGDDGNRSMAVQELTQLLSSSFKGKLLLVATGQNSLAGTNNLRKLMDRFTVSVDLQDADVDTVVRKTVLQKKAGVQELQALLTDREGEIARHLHGLTSYQFRSQDVDYMAADYPLLATRRRVWEWVQRAMDGAGTNSQLRGQLRLVYEAIQEYADKPLGQVVRGDYIFEKNSTGMLQASILTNELNNDIQALLAKDGPEEKLQGRILSMVFILNRLSHLQQEDKKIPATEATLTDLLVEDLKGRAILESRMTPALNALVKKGLLQRIDGAYLIQTKEGNAWHQTFEQEKNALANNPGALDAHRLEFLKSAFKTEVGGLVQFAMGETAQTRPIEIKWGSEPPSSVKGIPVWVQEGGSTTEEQVLRLAQANRDGHLVYVFIPREGSGDLSTQVVEMSAADQTLQLKASSHGPAADMARQAMQDTRKNADSRAKQIIQDMISQTRVWVAGGISVEGIGLKDRVIDGCEKMLLRKYPEFGIGDSEKWSHVLNLCRQGNIDRTDQFLGYSGDMAEHPAVRLVRSRIGSSARWNDITGAFDEAPYGWSLDTTEAILFLLWAMNLIEVHLPAPARAIISQTDRRELRKSTISTNLVQITPEDKMKWRGIMNTLDPKGPTTHGKELEQEAEGFQLLVGQYNASGGPAPAPKPEPFALLEEAQTKTAGNERLKFLADHAGEWKAAIQEWIERRNQLLTRTKQWEQLQTLLRLGLGQEGLESLRIEANSLLESRSLLDQSDPVIPLVRRVAEFLRAQVLEAWTGWKGAFDRERALLEEDPDWVGADAATRGQWMARVGVKEFAKPELGTDEKVVASLEATSLSTWQDQTDALGGRFSKLRNELVLARQPKTQAIKIPRRVLTNQTELEAYILELRQQVEPALSRGPVIVE